MRHTLNALCPAVCAVFFFAGSEAHAEIIHWSYSWTASPNILAADDHGTGGAALTHMRTQHVTNSRSIIATYLMTFSSAPPNHPDHIKNKLFHLILNLTDDQTHVSGKMTFTGLLNGTFTDNNVHLTISFIGQRTQKLHLGHHNYLVTLPPTLSDNSFYPFKILAKVEATHNPEPSSLVLGALGLVGAGFVGWRRRRQQRLAMPS